MSEHSLSQIEDRIQAILVGFPALAGWTVRVVESMEVAVEDDEIPVLLILSSNYDTDQADEHGQTIHRADIEVEAISATPSIGMISRANRNALGHVNRAIADDRTLDIGIQDIEPDDIAPVEPRGKDVGSASLKFRVTWFTPRDDWFTITTL